MKKLAFVLYLGLLLCTTTFAGTVNGSHAGTDGSLVPMIPAPEGLTINEVHFDGQLSGDEARFILNVDAIAASKGESSTPLLEGDVAVLPPQLPDSLKIVRDGSRYLLMSSHAGEFKFKLEVVARIEHDGQWNRVSFTGPSATIASVSAQATGADTEIQLLNGTLMESVKTNGVSRLAGFLGADQTVALRWQTRVAEVAHKALSTVDSGIAAQVTSTVIKYTDKFHYDIVQGSTTELTLALPSAQTLTHIDGPQIRDWNLAADGDRQILTVEFIKPLENNYDLTLSTEQTVENSNTSSRLDPAQPLNVEHESGSLVISADNTIVDITPSAGVRQVNAPDNAVAAYEFDERPLAFVIKLSPIQSQINVTDRVSAQLEEARLVVSHRLSLDVKKAGIYTLELTPQPGFIVADVRGNGIEDWNATDGKIHVDFADRVIGLSQLDVQLEQSLKDFPTNISVAPLHVTGATSETAQIGAAAAPGIRLRTGTLSGLREIPVGRLPDRSNEILAYTAAQSSWDLSIGTERLAAHVVADVFNLATIGDGIVGGSAIVRYGLINQGVQEFKVSVPASFKNIEFTGPGIRSKEFTNGVWTIGLQDKVWGGYTLVVTYDYQFDPAGATLPIGGIHALNVERETGSVAITTAANLQISTQTASDSLRRIDESELPDADRPFIARAVLLAYQYTGDKYDLGIGVKRFAEEPVLEAVADRTQITSVLTDSGQMLTEASFMVKNNEKQFQRFELPDNATLWACYVDGQPAKPERDGAWVLVPLARDADRDQAFAVDIMYAQTNGVLASTLGKPLVLDAPRTDVPNTYAEWRVFVPPTLRLSNFGGSMSVAEGTTYGILDAWEKFLVFYGQVLRAAGSEILLIGFLALMVIAFVISAVQRGWSGVLTLLGVMTILVILASMLLPVLGSAKRRAQRINSVSELKQIGLAARIYAGDNTNCLPVSLKAMKDELGSTQLMYDVFSGQPFVYLGAGMSLDSLSPDSVLAYSPPVNGVCNVLFADGSVAEESQSGFQELSQRGLVQLTTPNEPSETQSEAINENAGVTASQPPVEVPAPVAGGGAYFAVHSKTPGVAGFVQTLSPAPSAANGIVPQATAMPAVPGNSTGEPIAVGANMAMLPPPVAAGVRSIHIDLPQTGQPFLFTKVLNIGDEPLSIHARIIPLTVYQGFQMAWQTAAFLIGLAVWWVQWQRMNRNTFILTIALVMVIGSVCSLLVQWRALHDALIVGFPLTLLAVIALLIWKYWPRQRRTETGPAGSSPAPEPPPVVGNIPPVVAAVVLLFGLSLTGARAADFSAEPGSIVSANYSGTVNSRVAAVDATLEFAPRQADWIVPLFGSDVAVQQFIVKCGKAELVRSGNNLAVRIESRGKTTLEIKMLVKTQGDVTKRELAFDIPPALSSEMTFVLDEPEADVDFPTAVSFKRVLEKNSTQVEAMMGSASRADLLWTPRVKQAGEITATVFCQNAALVTFGGGVADVHAMMDYQITQGELHEARVQLPAGQRLLRVEGKGIRTWEIKNENGTQVLVVDLLEGMSSSWQLTVETEKNLDTLPASVAIAVPHVLDVKRETGFVALRGSDELALSIESTSGLERVDAQEFPNTDANSLLSVFEFSKPEFSLRARIETIQPELEAVAINNFRVGPEQISLSTRIDYTIKRTGIFGLEVALPDGYRVESVDGNNIEQQNEQDNGGSRTLNIVLKERATGAYTLNLQLVRDFKELPKSLAIAGVQPIGMARLTEYIAVSAEPGVAVKMKSFDGLMEIPAVSLPENANVAGNGNVLAYKFISSRPDSNSPWSLFVTTESVPPWVRAEVVNTISLTETLANGRARVRYDIANAPVKELRVRVPESFQNVEVTGPNIRSREQDGNVWRVELQSPVQGTYQLTVTWEQPFSLKAGTTEFDGVSADGVERETGLLAISAKAPMQANEARAEGLQRVDTGDFPDWAGNPDPSTALAYRYVRPGYKLSLNVRQLDDAEVLQAIVENARFTSIVADDGQMMTELSMSLQSNGRQFLEIALPTGATVWSAFVAGQPVQPGLRDGKLLLPIEQSSGDNGATSIELTYVGTNAFPHAKGQVGFVSPQFDVPLKNARWEVYLPPDYNYKNFEGTMTRETAPATELASTSFSSLDYSLMEQNSRSADKADALADLSEARQQLESGDTRDASAKLSIARKKLSAGELDNAGAYDLESDLKNAQASNLIAAQSDFTARNSIQSEDEITAGPVSQSGLQYDNADAQEQWSKLQQAQEIVSGKIQPLHVNLPVRGQHFTFTQVLQTETGEPMTIQLFAASTKAVNWPIRILTVAGVFMLLWIAVAVTSHLTLRSRKEMQAA